MTPFHHEVMPALMGAPLHGPTHSLYQTDFLLDELSRKMAASQAARRLSRGSNGQRPGNAMRIVKPTSANNSPRSSMMLARRRTLMNDSNMVRRKQQAMDQVHASLNISELADAQSRPSSRPVSWHPSSYQHAQQLPVQQPIYQYQFPTSTFNEPEIYTSCQPFPATPAAFSCNASPSSAFSPLSLPYSALEQHAFTQTEAWRMAAHGSLDSGSSSSDGSANTYVEPFPALPNYPVEATSPSTTMQWNSFALHGFSSTSPPTPEALPQSQQPQPAMSSEDSIPYQPLGDEEEEGEILVGMGLYDTPDKFESTPQLDAYRATLALLGTPFPSREGTGKGLKLEESWQPPESDDEAEDGEEDADGEDQVEEGTSSEAESQQDTQPSAWI